MGLYWLNLDLIDVLAKPSHMNNFFLQIRWAVGNDEKMQFWEEIWAGDLSCRKFPHFYRLILSKNEPIKSKMVRDAASEWRWNLTE